MSLNIKNLIEKSVKNFHFEEIILFGSRAKDRYNRFSDYDILLIGHDPISIKEKMKISGYLRRNLAKKGIDADIIIKSREEVDYYQDKIGSIVKQALEEGVKL